MRVRPFLIAHPPSWLKPPVGLLDHRKQPLPWAPRIHLALDVLFSAQTRKHITSLDFAPNHHWQLILPPSLQVLNDLPPICAHLCGLISSYPRFALSQPFCSCLRTSPFPWRAVPTVSSSIKPIPINLLKLQFSTQTSGVLNPLFLPHF